MPKLTQLIATLLFPPICIGCQQIGTSLCSQCGNQITFWENKTARTHQHHLYPSLRSINSATEYIDLSVQIVKSVKFSGAWQDARIMGMLLHLHCHSWIRQQKIDMFIPVPIHRKRRAERGFNQTEKISESLSFYNCISTTKDILIRTKYRQKQSLQNKTNRQSLHHDFSVQNAHKITGKTICVIDDVFTTGSTLSACARALDKAHPKRIVALTFARTR